MSLMFAYKRIRTKLRNHLEKDREKFPHGPRITRDSLYPRCYGTCGGVAIKNRGRV